MAPNKLAKLMKKEKERMKPVEEADRMTVPETERRTVPECWDEESTELCCSVPQEGSLSVVCLSPHIPDDSCAVRVSCSSSLCPKSGLMHTRCFEKFEDLVLRGLAMKLRSQPEKQLRMSMWQGRYKMCYEMCACDCGQGFLKRELEGSSGESPEISKSKAKNAKPMNNKPKLMTQPPQKKNKHNLKVVEEKRASGANQNNPPFLSIVEGAVSTIPGLNLTKAMRKVALVSISEDVEQKELNEEELGWNRVGKMGAVKKLVKQKVAKLNESKAKGIVQVSSYGDISKNFSGKQLSGKMVTPQSPVSFSPTATNPDNEYNNEKKLLISPCMPLLISPSTAPWKPLSPPGRQERQHYTSTDSQDSVTASSTLAWGTDKMREEIFHSDDSDDGTEEVTCESSLNKGTNKVDVDCQHRKLIVRKLEPVPGCVSLTACNTQRQLVVQLKEQNAELKEEIEDITEKLDINIQMKNVAGGKVKSLEDNKSGFETIVGNIQNEVERALNKVADTLDKVRVEQQLQSEALSSYSLHIQTSQHELQEMNRNVKELQAMMKSMANIQQEEKKKNHDNKIQILKQLEDMQELISRPEDPRKHENNADKDKAGATATKHVAGM